MDEKVLLETFSKLLNFLFVQVTLLLKSVVLKLLAVDPLNDYVVLCVLGILI